MTSLTSIQALSVQEVTGNISGITISGLNVIVAFTSGYTGGLNNYEGVMIYAKVLGSHPQFFQLENATLN